MFQLIKSFIYFRIEREQLQAIFELLRKQENEHDLGHMEESDLREQLNLYR